MNFRHNIWGYFEVTDPFEVTNEVTEIFDFQNFSRQFAHFCSSYEKASKCYEEIEMWNSGFLRDRIDYQTVSCCVLIWRSTIARRQDTANVKEIGSGTFHSRPVVLVSVR